MNPLKVWLSNHRISQELLAREINVSYQLINNFVTDRHLNITTKTLIKICEFTTIPYKEMIEYIKSYVEAA